MTQIYEALTDTEKRQVRMYGCTEQQMREVVEASITFRCGGPAMIAASIMSDCQEMLAHDDGGQFDLMLVEDVRQSLNRAKWILFNYVVEKRV